MPNKKISELPAATVPLSGAELMEVVQGGINKQVAKSDVATGGGGTVTSVTGTASRIAVDLTNPAVPVINIDAAYDAAVTAQIAAAAVGLLDDRGNFDASVNAYPSSGGSGTAGAILKGDLWRISVAGTLPTGVIVQVGDAVRALVDTPGNTQANWAILEGAVPDADATTKGIARLYPSTSLGTNTDGAPDQNAVKIYVDNAVATNIGNLLYLYNNFI